MTTQTEALKLALEALENVEFVSGSTDWVDDCVAAAEAIKEALAQPEEEKLHPVHIGVDVTKEGTAVTAFYRKPNAVMEMFYSQFHPLAQPAVAEQHKQEPVAWRETHSKIIKALAAIVTVHTPDKLFDLDAIPRDPVMHLVQQIKAAIDGYKPPQRKPLTDEQIADIVIEMNGNEPTALFWRDLAQAIEEAHGIKE